MVSQARPRLRLSERLEATKKTGGKDRKTPPHAQSVEKHSNDERSKGSSLSTGSSFAMKPITVSERRSFLIERKLQREKPIVVEVREKNTKLRESIESPTVKLCKRGGESSKLERNIYEDFAKMKKFPKRRADILKSIRKSSKSSPLTPPKYTSTNQNTSFVSNKKIIDWNTRSYRSKPQEIIETRDEYDSFDSSPSKERFGSDFIEYNDQEINVPEIQNRQFKPQNARSSKLSMYNKGQNGASRIDPNTFRFPQQEPPSPRDRAIEIIARRRNMLAPKPEEKMILTKPNCDNFLYYTREPHRTPTFEVKRSPIPTLSNKSMKHTDLRNTDPPTPTHAQMNNSLSQNGLYAKPLTPTHAQMNISLSQNGSYGKPLTPTQAQMNNSKSSTLLREMKNELEKLDLQEEELSKSEINTNIHEHHDNMQPRHEVCTKEVELSTNQETTDPKAKYKEDAVGSLQTIGENPASAPAQLENQHDVVHTHDTTSPTKTQQPADQMSSTDSQNQKEHTQPGTSINEKGITATTTNIFEGNGVTQIQNQFNDATPNLQQTAAGAYSLSSLSDNVSTHFSPQDNRNNNMFQRNSPLANQRMVNLESTSTPRLEYYGMFHPTQTQKASEKHALETLTKNQIKSFPLEHSAMRFQQQAQNQSVMGFQSSPLGGGLINSPMTQPYYQGTSQNPVYQKVSMVQQSQMPISQIPANQMSASQMPASQRTFLSSQTLPNTYTFPDFAPQFPRHMNSSHLMNIPGQLNSPPPLNFRRSGFSEPILRPQTRQVRFNVPASPPLSPGFHDTLHSPARTSFNMMNYDAGASRRNTRKLYANSLRRSKYSSEDTSPSFGSSYTSYSGSSDSYFGQSDSFSFPQGTQRNAYSTRSRYR